MFVHSMDLPPGDYFWMLSIGIHLSSAKLFLILQCCRYLRSIYLIDFFLIVRMLHLWTVWISFPFRTNEPSSPPLKHRGDPAYIPCAHFTSYSISHPHFQSSWNTNCVKVSLSIPSRLFQCWFTLDWVYVCCLDRDRKRPSWQEQEARSETHGLT